VLRIRHIRTPEGCLRLRTMQSVFVTPDAIRKDAGPGSAPMPKLLGLYAHRVKNSLAIVASMLQRAIRALAYPLDFNCAPQGASECA
jgi:hypothetical protein